MEIILQGFKDLAEVLPRLDKLRLTFAKDTDFKKVVGLIYSDIIEFHQRVYKIFRRKAWQVWFAISWGLFERRFKVILQKLSLHCELLDKEAAAAHYCEMKQLRDELQLKEDASERQRQFQLSQDVFRWLSAAEDQQEEQLERISDKRQPETCDWVLSDPQMRPWIQDDTGDAVLWMTGIPGAGKSFLCSLVIGNLQSKQHLSTLYFFCSHQSSSESICSIMLRTLAIQLLQQNLDMASLVHQAYLQKGSNRSGPTMKNLLIKLLPASKKSRIIIDGMDEISLPKQQEVLKSLVEIQKNVDDSCKLLVSSRDEPQIQKSLATKNHLRLGGKTVEGLNLYIKDSVKHLQEHFPAIDPAVMSLAEQRLHSKAKGMFLFARLVTNTLIYQTSETEFEKAINQLPEGLDEAYGRILSRIDCLCPVQLRQRAFSILYWVCAARRPISIHEVVDGIVLHPGQTILNRRTRSNDPGRDIVGLCAPLLEVLGKGILDLVHHSAREYLIDKQSGPFIDTAQAHLSIAMSCVINLTSCLDLVPGQADGISEGELESRVVQGRYGLQSYGQEFWAEHVLAYLGKVGSQEHGPEELIVALEAFSEVWKHGHSGTLLPATPHTPEASLGLNYPRFSPRLHRFISGWLHFQSEFNKTRPTFNTLDSQERWRLEKDETFLSLIHSRLRTFTERLLMMQSSQLPSHVDENDFKHFVSRYKYPCRYQGCNHQCDTVQERDSHEASHILSFPCLHCDFSGRGFRSRKDLENHTRRYHMSPEDFEIPDDLHTMGGDSRGGLEVTSGAFRMPSSRSGGWTERGRKAIQQGFLNVLTKLESEIATATGDDEGQRSRDITSAEEAGPSLGQHSNEAATMMSLDSIRHGVAQQSYVSLTDFKNDLNVLSGYPTAASMSAGRIASICDEELEKAMSAFPAFAHFDHTASTRGTDMATSSSSTEQLQGSAKGLNGQKSDMASPSLVSGSTRAPYWSLPEEKQFPELLQRYGRDFVSIADHLKTKTPEEVGRHFSDLVSSGKTELSYSADLAEDRLKREARSIGITMNLGDSELEIQAPDDLAHGNSQHFLQSSEALNAGPYFSPVGNTNTPLPLMQKRTERVEPNVESGENPVGPVRKKRRPRPRAPCPYCSLHVDGLRDEYALGKHIERFHTATRKVWICKDISFDSKFFTKCKSCSSSKRYRSKNDAGKHLRKAHFNAETSAETLQRWMRETEEPNPNMQTPSGDSTAATRPTIKNKTTKGEIFSFPPVKHHLDGPRTLPNTIFEAKSQKPSNSASSSRSSLSPDNNLDDDAEMDATDVSLPSLAAVISKNDVFFEDISFDNLLPGNASVPRLLDNDGPPHRINRALIRPDQVSRLPNLEPFRKAACLDQVEALYHKLDNALEDSSNYKEALEDLTSLSTSLKRNLRDWRQHSTLAPKIPFSI